MGPLHEMLEKLECDQPILKLEAQIDEGRYIFHFTTLEFRSQSGQMIQGVNGLIICETLRNDQGMFIERYIQLITSKREMMSPGICGCKNAIISRAVRHGTLSWNRIQVVKSMLTLNACHSEQTINPISHNSNFYSWPGTSALRAPMANIFNRVRISPPYFFLSVRPYFSIICCFWL